LIKKKNRKKKVKPPRPSRSALRIDKCVAHTDDEKHAEAETYRIFFRPPNEIYRILLYILKILHKQHVNPQLAFESRVQYSRTRAYIDRIYRTKI